METIKTIMVNTSAGTKFFFCDNGVLLQGLVEDYAGDDNALFVELESMLRSCEIESITEDSEFFDEFINDAIIIKEI